MRQFYLLSLLLLAFHGRSSSSPADSSARYRMQDTAITAQDDHPADSLLYIIIPGVDHTYGYDIFRNGRRVIHQPSIPCLPGVAGFSTKRRAQKVAVLVMEKIRK